MKTFIILLVCLHASFLFAQFGTQNLLTSRLCVGEIDNLFSTDVDNDGDIDVVVILDSAGKIAWLVNNGTENFNYAIDIDTNLGNNANRPFNIKPADFNNDGRVDILAVIANGRDLVWYENKGNGQFSSRQLIATRGDGFTSLQRKDLDGDGDEDIISAEYGGENLFWFENDGAGNFEEEQLIATVSRRASVITVADLDSDGDLDVVAGDNATNMPLGWYENDGNQEFTLQSISNSASTNTLLAVDIDLDNDIDLVTDGNSRSSVFIWENDGSANYVKKIFYSHTNGNRFKIIPQIRDLENDGDLDIVSVEGNDDLIVTLVNDGTGAFLADTARVSNPIHSLHFSDIDSDGDLDFLATRKNSSQLTWYQSEGNVIRTEGNVLEPFSKIEYSNSLRAVDIDTDGDLDLVAIGTTKNTTIFDKIRLIVWKYDESEGFAAPERITVARDNFTRRIGAIDFADKDKDGDIDILGSTADEGGGGNPELFWLLNDGIGNFILDSIEVTVHGGGGDNVYAVDIGADGDMDVFTSSNYDDRVVWYENLDSLYANPKNIRRNMGGNANVSIFDVDNDNELEAVTIASADNPGVIVHERTERPVGESFFDSVSEVDGASGGLSTVRVADFDLDGDLDMLGIRYYGGEIGVYENQGDGTFAILRNLDSLGIGDFISVDIGDIDLDGDIDLLVATSSYANVDNIRWYENDGTGHFVQKHTIEVAFSGGYVVLADIDQDGDLDAVILGGNQKLAWYENKIDLPAISGQVFLDKNDNGQMDSVETTLQNHPVTISPSALSTYTTTDGEYQFFVENGTYILQIDNEINACVTPVENTISVVIEDAPIVQNLAVQQTNEGADIAVRLTSGPTRCGFEVPFSLDVENVGCVTASGHYGLVLSPLVTLLEMTIPPVETRGDTLLWDFEQLAITERTTIDLSFRIAGTEFLGDTIQMSILGILEDENNIVQLQNEYDFRSEIRCAYDPNDKLVMPNRSSNYEQNYALFGEQLEYIVRFQNTGTDTAFTVIIHDQLDRNLDWTTFKPGHSSHIYTATRQEDGLVKFTFEDILLPDSTTNEIGSHGFVRYQIQPKAGLPEETSVQNTAEIYFDFNPAIVTNTTDNVYVSELPTTTNVPEILAIPSYTLVPNPARENVWIIPTGAIHHFPYQVLLYDNVGKLVLQTELQTGRQVLPVENLLNGIYFYFIQDKDGWLQKNGKIVKMRK